MERTTGEANPRRRIFLDTNICIGVIKADKSILKILENLPGRPAITSVTVFELLLRKTNIAAAETFINNADIFPFDENSAIEASKTFKELEKKGKSIPYRDFFIAATVVANGGELITLNKKDFENIDGLKIVEI